MATTLQTNPALRKKTASQSKRTRKPGSGPANLTHEKNHMKNKLSREALLCLLENSYGKEFVEAEIQREKSKAWLTGYIHGWLGALGLGIILFYIFN